MNWTLFEDPGAPLWCLQPMEKCMQTRKHKCTFTILISSWQCNYSKKRLLFYRLENSAQITDIPTSGSAIKKPLLTKTREGNFLQNGPRRTSCCSRVIHQFCRQFVVNIDIAGFVFNKSSPRAKWRTSCRKLVRITLKDPQPKKKMAIEIRTTVCEIFLNGWRSSQIIWRTLKCMHPHTFLRTQIRHVPRKWYQNKGTTVFTLNSQKTEMAKSAGEPKWQGVLAEDALAKLYLEQKSLVTW